MNTPRSLKVSIGGKTIAMQSADRAFWQMLYEWCHVFQVANEPDFWIDFELQEGRSAPEIQGVLPRLHLSFADGVFKSHPDLLEGELSLQERRLRLRADRALFDAAIQPRFMNVILSSVYNTVCEDKTGTGRPGFLFHGCGVIAQGRGYLFTGPSGVGKTTVARLAGERTVLNDEVILLRLMDGGVWMEGTPLLGGVNRRSSARVRLHAVFMLAHGDRVQVRALDRHDAYQQFLFQLFAPDPFVSEGRSRGGLLQQQMSFADRALRGVVVHELRFLPDDSFWPVIEEL